MTATPHRCRSGPPGDRVAAAPAQALTATFSALRSFATTVGRLQVDLLQAVAAEHTRTERDLAEWALEMYGQLRRAVELQTDALRRLVPPEPHELPRPAAASWIEDTAADLGRILNTLAHDDAALVALLLNRLQPSTDEAIIVLPDSDKEAA